MNRRDFLRGAGVTLSLPFLEYFHLNSLPASTPKIPLRFGIFTVTGGTVLESWKPAKVGPLQELPSILRSLQPHQKDLLILSGLSHSGRVEGGLNAHEHCSLLHLTGCDVVKKVDGKLIAGISVDQAAAQHLGKNTFLPSLELGLGSAENKYSFKSAELPVTFEANPRLAFERMFRNRKPSVPNWQNRIQPGEKLKDSKNNSIEHSILDLVLEESKDLKQKLGQHDHRRLDEYLESVRTIEQRLAFVEERQRQEAADLVNPGPSKTILPNNLPKDGLAIWQITQPVYRDPERHAEYIRLMADLMILAFQTDTTRVCTFAAGSDEAHFPGVVTVGYERHCHTLEHQGNASRVEDADPIAREACRQIHSWYTQLFSEMVTRMKSIDEGGSSLLDNTMLMYTSYMADGGHGTHDYPVILVGNAQGSLKTGRHIAYHADTPISNLYVECLNRLGITTSRFGNNLSSPKRQYAGRLPDLQG